MGDTGKMPVAKAIRYMLSPDTRGVRNLGRIGIDMERAVIRAALFVFQDPKEACLELCWSRCFVRSAMF